MERNTMNTQRTIKFRAWDKLEKRFFYPDKGYQGHYVLYLNGQFQNLQNGSGGDEYVVQQWTVLKDNFGNEIWEGDIIEFKRKDREGFHKAEIKFVEGAYLAKFIKHEGTLSLFRLLQLNYYCNIKVIGNIFENSELLKQ